MNSLQNETKFKALAATVIKVGNRVESLQLYVGFILTAGFLLVVAVDVFFREVATPILWSDEVARFSYMWAVFFGSGVALRRGGHFKIDVITVNLHGNAKKICDVIQYICTATFVLILAFSGYEYAMMGLNRVSNPSGIPLIIATACIPVSSVFMAYYVVEGIISKLAGVDVPSGIAEIQESAS